MVSVVDMRKPVLVRHVLWDGVKGIGYVIFNFFIVHFFRVCCSSMRQVGVGSAGMDGEGRAGGMVRMGGVAGSWRWKKV